MKRMIRMTIAGSLAAVALAAGAARADEWHHTMPMPPPPVARPMPQAEPAHYRGMEARRAFRALEEERERFYRDWRGNRMARWRFERYYQRRMADLHASYDRGNGERGWRG